MIDKLKKLLPENTAIYIEKPENRRYYTNFDSSNGYIFATKDFAVFYTDFRYITAAKNYVNKKIEVREIKESRIKEISDLVKKHNIKTLITEEDYLSYNFVSRLKEALSSCKTVPDGKDYTFSFRMIKTEAEIEKIRKAQEIADKGFDFIKKLISERKYDLSEKEAACRLEFFLKSEGADGIAFDTIAAFGENSAIPHAEPTDRKIKDGDALLFDYGAKKDGYMSDITRTVFFKTASDEQKNVYDIVLLSQKTALEKIKAGISGKECDAFARDVISSKGYGEFFGHSLGHSVGLEIHESPNFSPSEDMIIPENSVITVEPGIYLENRFGVRIEDLVVVKRNGVENLTLSDNRFTVI